MFMTSDWNGFDKMKAVGCWIPSSTFQYKSYDCDGQCLMLMVNGVNHQ